MGGLITVSGVVGEGPSLVLTSLEEGRPEASEGFLQKGQSQTWLPLLGACGVPVGASPRTAGPGVPFKLPGSAGDGLQAPSWSCPQTWSVVVLGYGLPAYRGGVLAPPGACYTWPQGVGATPEGEG